jgi:hypothetical protein
MRPQIALNGAPNSPYKHGSLAFLTLARESMLLRFRVAKSTLVSTFDEPLRRSTRTRASLCRQSEPPLRAALLLVEAEVLR